MWNVRGGGLYACGFAVTFIVLEVGSVVEDVKDIGLLFDGHAAAFVLNFIADSFGNTWQAFAWPVNIVQLVPPFGAIGLGLAFMLFPKYLKKPIESWLFSDEADPGESGSAESDQ